MRLIAEIQRGFTFNNVRGTVTLRPSQSADSEVDTVSLEPPQQPTTIDDVLHKDMNNELLEHIREAVQSIHTTVIWSDQATGRTNVVQQTIDTVNARPRGLPTRQIPSHFHDELDAIIGNLLTQGIITPFSSLWAAPVSLVKKKRLILAPLHQLPTNQRRHGTRPLPPPTNGRLAASTAINIEPYLTVKVLYHTTSSKLNTIIYFL